MSKRSKQRNAEKAARKAANCKAQLAPLRKKAAAAIEAANAVTITHYFALSSGRLTRELDRKLSDAVDKAGALTAEILRLEAAS